MTLRSQRHLLEIFGLASDGTTLDLHLLEHLLDENSVPILDENNQPIDDGSLI